MNRREPFLLGFGFVALCAYGALDGDAGRADTGGAAPPSIETCFAPESDCARLIADAIGQAEQSVLVSVYGFTIGPIADALAAAKKRGVAVEVVADRSTPCLRHTGIPAMFNAGIPVWIDRYVRLAHEKALVIDGHLTIEGSYNFTADAALNSEDVNLIESPEIAAAYAQHWRLRRAKSIPYTSASDWCAHGMQMINSPRQ